MAVFVSILRYGPLAPKAARKPSFPALLRLVQLLCSIWECLHTWWWPWSSKPVEGLNKALCGFDSHTFPLVFHFTRFDFFKRDSFDL